MTMSAPAANALALPVSTAEMVPELAIAMLACARIGAIHSVVFGGFASHSLATRIDDAKPKLMFTADAGMRAGKAVHYKGLVDDSIKLSEHPPEKVVLFNRGIDTGLQLVAGRDVDYAALRDANLDAQVPVIWNIGAIARSGHPRALETVRKVLLASAAIPGAFPPTMIDVTVDGTDVQGRFLQEGRTERTFKATLSADMKFKTTAVVGGGNKMDVVGSLKEGDATIMLDGYCLFEGKLTKKQPKAGPTG